MNLNRSAEKEAQWHGPKKEWPRELTARRESESALQGGRAVGDGCCASVQ